MTLANSTSMSQSFSDFELSIKQAVTHILAGDIIAYPTETVYGLGCNAFQQNALRTLQQLKQRSEDKSFIVLVADTLQARELIHPEAEIQLIEAAKSWPGPTTWVFRARDHLPPELTLAGKVAIRISAHPMAQRLCALARCPIVSTSANLRNQTPLASAQSIYEAFKPYIAGIMQGEPGKEKPSKIIDAATLEVLRD